VYFIRRRDPGESARHIIHNLTKRGTFVTAQPNRAHLCCKHLKAEQIKAWGSGPPKKPICQFCGFGGPQFCSQREISSSNKIVDFELLLAKDPRFLFHHCASASLKQFIIIIIAHRLSEFHRVSVRSPADSLRPLVFSSGLPAPIRYSPVSSDS
jgi:hypothetical protein